MPLADNLVAYWKLDEASGARAEQVNSYTLTDNNTVTSATGLVYGTAASFASASNEYLDIADNANLSGGDADFTVAAWVYLTDTGGNHDVLGKGDGGGYEYLIQYSASNSRWQFKVASATGEANAIFVRDGGDFGGGSAPSTNTWYLVIGWHDSVNNLVGIATSTSSLAVETKSYSFGAWDSTGNFNIGRGGSFFPNYMDGRIGPVMVWRRVLSSADRTALYNGGAGVTYAAMTSGGGAASTGSGLLLRGVGT